MVIKKRDRFCERLHVAAKAENKKEEYKKETEAQLQEYKILIETLKAENKKELDKKETEAFFSFPSVPPWFFSRFLSSLLYFFFFVCFFRLRSFFLSRVF